MSSWVLGQGIHYSEQARAGEAFRGKDVLGLALAPGSRSVRAIQRPSRARRRSAGVRRRVDNSMTCRDGPPPSA